MAQEQDKLSLLPRIMSWARDIELNVTQVEDPNADFHLKLMSTLPEEQLPPLNVIHLKAGKYIIILAGIEMPPEILKPLAMAEKSLLEKTLWDIKLRLLQMDVDFTTRNVSATELPYQWQLSVKMLIEDATPQTFNDLYMKIRNAALIVAWSYRSIYETVKNLI